MAIINVTCRTEGCSNQDFAIAFPDPEDLVICGGCNNEIIDKTPTNSEENK